MQKGIALIVALLSPLACYGQSNQGPLSTGSTVGQTVLGLGVVIFAILLLAWTAKRLNVGGMGRNKVMQVIAALPVGAKEKIVLVTVGDQQILLGVAPGRVATLQVFDTPVIDLSEDEKTPEGRGQSGKATLGATKVSEFSKKLNELLSQGIKS